MPFTTINSTEIDVGQPTKQELFTKIKDNFDDHEDRIGDIEAATLTTTPIQFIVKGLYWQFGAANGVAYIRAAYNLTLTGGRIFVVDAGSSGTVEIDVQKKSGGGAFASVFSTRPTVAFGAGDYAVSSNGVIGTASVLAGDILRLDIVGVQTGNEEFHVYLPHNVA